MALLRILTVLPVVPRTQALGVPAAVTSVNDVDELGLRIEKVCPDIVVVPAAVAAATAGALARVRSALAPEVLLCVAAAPGDSGASLSSEDLACIGSMVRMGHLEEDLLRSWSAHAPTVAAEAVQRLLLASDR
jgi:hypothetical protein